MGLRLGRVTLAMWGLGAWVVAGCGDDTGTAFSSGESSGNRDTIGETWGGPQDAASSDTSSPTWSDTGTASDTGPNDAGGNTTVSFGGAADFGYVRALIADGRVPQPREVEPEGFFAEHVTPLPPPSCGKRICVQAMLGVMDNLVNGTSCTMIQVGLNSPIVVDPASRPPLSLAVVVDVSGSMQSESKIDFVKRGLERLVSELNDDDRLALITYSDTVSVVAPMREVRGQRNALLGMVRGLVANGGTNLYGGLEAGYQALETNWDSGRQNRVILLSDGAPTAGITDTGAILAMSVARNSDGIGLTTVGLGVSFNVTLMRGLAEQADGNFYFLENSTAVDEVFTEELAYFTVPVAFDVDLEVVSGPLYDLQRATGSKRFEIAAGEGSLHVPSVFLAHRESPDDVFEGEDGGTGRRGGGSMLLLEMMPKSWDGAEAIESLEVATVKVGYREPGTDARVFDEVRVEYPHAPGMVLPTGFFDNAIVTKSFVVLNLYFAIEQAVLLHHGGQSRAARDLLRQVIAAAEDYEDSANDGAGDIDIRLDVVLLSDLADVITRVGRVDEPPPAPPSNPWPCD